MYDMRENFLAHTALACDEHCEIGRRYALCYADRMVERGRVAYDAEAIFY
jgi:hypothetical protein